MSYKDKPIIKLYKWENNSFVLQAIIDDFQEVSFEHNIYEAGTFTITINYNIPNALLFQRGLFVQFGNNPYDFGEIYSIQDAIGEDGKGSQIRTITGYDARYILKRRVIKNMNSNGLWAMTDKGEIVLRNLIKDQCGTSAEAKRQLPIANTIPASADAIGKVYSVSENFTNLYEVCKTIATQSEIGWRMAFDGTLTLEVFEGADLSQTVRFDTNFESLANGDFSDSSESYSNAIYIGGKGQNDNRDIYEGEDGTPEGLDRFESWDNQSSLTVESEYEAEALSMLTQYGQTLTMNGNGLAKCPYVFREQYDIGDTVTVAFSGKSAKAQILSITEHWTWGSYDISFAFGKPQNNLADQLQLMLRKIQEASNKTNSTDSVRWYTIPTDTAMPKADVTYNTIGFVGTVGTGATFTLYLDNEKTGAKTYHVYFKQLGGTGKLTLTTGKAGATNLTLNAGTYVAIIYVDENGNITNTASTPTNTIETGNTQPATSNGVSSAIDNAVAGQSGTRAEITIGEVAWIKVCSIENWSRGDVLELYFQNNWNTVGSSARKITIVKGTTSISGYNHLSWITVKEEASDPQILLSEIQICGADSASSTDKVFIYVKYNKTTSNTIRMAYKSVGSLPPTIYMTKESPSGYTLNLNYALHDKGVYVNGANISPINSITDGSMQPATSNAVFDNKYLFVGSRVLSEAGWYKIAEFGYRDRGDVISIDLWSAYFYQQSCSHKIQINYGFTEIQVLDFAQDRNAVFDKIKVCYNTDNADVKAIYVHYTPNQQNSVWFNINAGTTRITPYSFLTDSLTWVTAKEFALGNYGLYINEGHAGYSKGMSYQQSTSWYLIITPKSTTANLDLEITDQYGGLVKIVGNLNYDIALGGSYHSIKAKRILNGNWNSDEGTGSQKISSVGILGTEKAICVTMGSYSTATVVNNSRVEIDVTYQTTAPTITRAITLQA